MAEAMPEPKDLAANLASRLGAFERTLKGSEH